MTPTCLYDPAGNRQAQIADGQRTTYSYDQANRLTQAIDPYGQITSYTHDAAGHRTKVEGPEGITFYTWNAAGQMIAAEPPTVGGPIRFTYNADGKRMKKEMPDGQVTHYLYGHSKGSGVFDQRLPTPLKCPACEERERSMTHDPLGDSGRMISSREGDGRIGGAGLVAPHRGCRAVYLAVVEGGQRWFAAKIWWPGSTQSSGCGQTK